MENADQRSLNTTLVDGFIQLGRNICAFDGLEGEQTSGHYLHRAGTSHSDGFELAEIGRGPFQGTFYVKRYTAMVGRAELISADLNESSNLYAENTRAGTKTDFEVLRASVVDHEHHHSSLIAAALSKVDRAKAIEKVAASSSERLTDLVNVELVKLDTALEDATTDDKVKAKMRGKWGNRAVTVRLRDGAGGFVTRTFRSLAELGD